MLIGYLRGRAGDEGSLRAQRKALADAGGEQVVEDLAVGRRWKQPELRRTLDALQAGDVVVVTQLDHLGRTLAEVVRRVQRITAAGAGLRSLKEGIDTTTEAGRAAVQVIGNLAALDRGAARDSINAGLAAARAEGRRGGRRPKLSEQQRMLIADEVLAGRSTAARMARLYRVSEATISRVMTAYPARAGAPPGGRGAVDAADRDDRIAGALPPSALNDRLAIVGTSGSGKTYAAKGLAERLMERVGRVCIVDPLGVWWGLGRAADGHAPLPLSRGGVRRHARRRGARPWHGRSPRPAGRHAANRLRRRRVRPRQRWRPALVHDGVHRGAV